MAAIGLALLACEVAPPAGPPPVAPGLRMARVPLDAGAPIRDAAVDPAPADAPIDAALPALSEVEDPRPWVFRKTSLGMVVHAVRETSTLRRAGDRASLRVVVEDGHTSMENQTPAWTVTSSETFVGTVRRENRRTVLELSSAAGKSVKLTCRPDRIPVHRAGATLVPDPSFHSECGNQGVWRPVGRQTVEVLACQVGDRSMDDEVDQIGQFGTALLAFAPAPGVESIFVNNDCLLQGGGYRRRSAND